MLACARRTRCGVPGGVFSIAMYDESGGKAVPSLRRIRTPALAQPRDDVRDGDLFVVAHLAQLNLDPLAVGRGLVHDRAWLHPFVAPLGQGDDDRLQLESFWCEHVFRLLARAPR